MEDFLPGDIVEFIDDNTRGKVVSIISNSEVMIELEEGLEIPAAKNQLILVNKPEENISNKKDRINGIEKREKLNRSNKGIFLGFEYEESNSKLNFYVLNDSADFIYYILYSKQNGRTAGLSKGNCNAYSYSMSYNIWLHESDILPQYHIQLIRFSLSPENIPPAIEFSFKISQKKLLTRLENAPLLNKPMYLIPLQGKSPASGIARQAESQPNVKITRLDSPQKIEISRPSEIVDLHIQNLRQDHQCMTRGEIFNYQFNYFVNSLEKALALNYSKIIFIHGIGSGVLKSRIITYLKQRKGILTYRDADIKKYGYGATQINFRKRD